VDFTVTRLPRGSPSSHDRLQELSRPASGESRILVKGMPLKNFHMQFSTPILAIR
jgi:hypothetical protein